MGCRERGEGGIFFSFHIALLLYTDAVLHSDTQGDNCKRYNDSKLNCLCCCWTKFYSKPTSPACYAAGVQYLLAGGYSNSNV